MSISAVTADTGGPPGVTVTITAAANITSLALYRSANGVKTLTSVQPRTGATTAQATDYQLPWDTDVTYSATYSTGSGNITDTAAPINVSATGGWMIHPVFPLLSVPLTGVDIWTISVETASRAATASTLHNIVGSRYPVVVTSGPRQADTLTITLGAGTPEAEAAIWAVIDDLTPLLIRYPVSMGTSFDEGFYAVGDVTADRLGAAAGEPFRLFTLPITRVGTPAVTQQLAWDYPTLTASFADYGSLTAAFADYGSVVANRRKS